MGVRRAIRRLRRVLFGVRNATEIDRVRAALRRHEAKVDEQRRQWARSGGICCPGCMFGYEAADQCERTARWLARLLDKRGRPEDLREARSLRADLPPEREPARDRRT